MRLAAQCFLGLFIDHTQASDGFQRCSCPQWGHWTGSGTFGRLSKRTVSVSKPVCVVFPVTGQLIKIAGMQAGYSARDLRATAAPDIGAKTQIIGVYQQAVFRIPPSMKTPAEAGDVSRCFAWL